MPRITEEQRLWLSLNLPVILQPQVDVDNGYGLVGVFVHFKQSTEQYGHSDQPEMRFDCQLHILFEGEASYDRTNPNRVNTLGTFLYRSYNFYMYGRTADINQLAFEGVDTSPEATRPWKRITTCDYNGLQSWSQGLKGDLFHYYSLDFHYELSADAQDWHYDEVQSTRPILYINTHNHMHGNRDRNPDMLKQIWRDYPVWAGTSRHAEYFSRLFVPVKPNLLSWAWWMHNRPKSESQTHESVDDCDSFRSVDVFEGFEHRWSILPKKTSQYPSSESSEERGNEASIDGDRAFSEFATKLIKRS